MSILLDVRCRRGHPLAEVHGGAGTGYRIETRHHSGRRTRPAADGPLPTIRFTRVSVIPLDQAGPPCPARCRCSEVQILPAAVLTELRTGRLPRRVDITRVSGMLMAEPPPPEL